MPVETISRLSVSMSSFLPMSKRWKLLYYRDELGYSPYLDWVTTKLSAPEKECFSRVLNNYLLRFGDTKPKANWLSNLTEGLYQLRIQEIDSDGKRTILIRIYVHFYGNNEILVISGYDKLKYPEKLRQQEEIRRARKILREWRENDR